MGVLNNKKKVVFRPLTGDTTASSEDEGPLNRNEATSEEEQVPIQRLIRPRPPPSPVADRKAPPTFGLSLKLKKGRRARHRYDSERDLFAMADDINPDEVPEGWDIANETTSRFRKLLDNQILLEQFLNEDLHNNSEQQEIQTDFKNEIFDDDNDNNDPETSYLRISAHLRQALKKHLPWGILENLEEQIVEHFVTNPSDCFLASNLSSYERLLAHVCSMYNQLSSQSFDDNGIRTLKIVNPRRKFHPIDPSLCEYLKTRKNKIF